MDNIFQGILKQNIGVSEETKIQKNLRKDTITMDLSLS